MNLLCAVLFLFFLSPLISQTEQLKFRHIGVEEGAISDAYYGMTADKRGYIWLAGESGISVYNGRTFTAKIYSRSSGSFMRTTLDIAIDNNGYSWGSTLDGRIYCVRGDSVFFPPCSDSLSSFLLNGKKLINQIGFDEENNLWIGNAFSLVKSNASSGYTSLDRVSGINDTVTNVIRVLKKGVTVMSRNRLDMPDNAERSRRINSDKSYIISTQVFFRNGKSRLFCLKRSPAHRPIPTGESTELEDGSVLFSIGTTLFHVYADGRMNEYEFPQIISFVGQDRLNNIWVGTMEGVYRYRNGKLGSAPEIYLSDMMVTGVLLDHEYGVWVSSGANGIYYCPNIYHTYYQESTLAHNGYCRTLFNDNGSIYGFSNKNGIMIVDSTDRMRIVPGSLKYEMFGFIDDDKRKYVWGTRLYTCDKDFGNAKRIANYNIVAGCKATDDTFYFLSYADLYREEKDSLIPVCSIPRGRGTAMAVGNDGRIWVGSIVGLYELVGDSLFDRSIIPDLKDTITRVKKLYVDTKGNLYAACLNKGLYILHRNSWHRMDTTIVPEFNSFNTAFVDENDFIWTSNSHNVFRFKYDFDNRKIFDLLQYNWSSGLNSSYIMGLCAVRNKIFCATNQGISVIDCDPKSYNSVPPPVFISRVELNGKILPGQIEHDLNYNQNNLRFFIDVLNYQAQGKPRFKYKLVGFEDEFQTTGEASVYYSNLNPGEYELQVIGISNNNVESKPLLLHFTILRPSWSTWWFITLEVIVCIGLIALIVRYFIRRVKAREEERTKINIQLASYQMTALRSQMNPHFTFNAINSIQRFVLRNERETAYDYLSKFSRLIRQVLDNSKEEMISIQNELDTLRLYLEMERLRFEHEFSFETEIDSSIPLSDTYIPCMLVQPFVENAIWHGIMPLADSRKGIIKLQFLRKGISLLICVEDNGVGRKARREGSKTHQSMGINIAKKRLHLYDMRSKKNLSFISYVDLKDEHGQACGTIAQIELANFFVQNGH